MKFLTVVYIVGTHYNFFRLANSVCKPPISIKLYAHKKTIISHKTDKEIEFYSAIIFRAECIIIKKPLRKASSSAPEYTAPLAGEEKSIALLQRDERSGKRRRAGVHQPPISSISLDSDSRYIYRLLPLLSDSIGAIGRCSAQNRYIAILLL